MQCAAVEALHGPQRGAPVEAGRAEGIGVGEGLQHAAGRAAPEPYRSDAGVAPAACRYDAPGRLLGEAVDETETEADGAGSPRTLRGFPLPACGERVRVRGSPES